MGIIVTLGPTINATYFDEAAIYATALSPSTIAAHYNASLATYLADPQDTPGWEEAYGPTYPITTGDVPVLSNGLVQMRYDPVTKGFSIDSYIDQVGWMEQGRVTLWHDDAGIAQQGTLVSSQIVEWTMERAVIQVTTNLVIASLPYRMDTFWTLQRGWPGFRIECYPMPKGATKLGAHIRFSPYLTDAVVAHSPATAPASRVSDEAGWNNAVLGNFAAAGAENWVTLTGLRRSVTMAVLRSAVKARTYDDTAAYGTTRKALAICADQGVTAVEGYVTTFLALSSRGLLAEAEDARWTKSGTASNQADGAASGGTAVKDTQTSNAANTITLPSAQLTNLGLGKYAVWIRWRATTGGDTASANATWTGDTNATTPTTTSTTFVWSYAGETTRDATTDDFRISVWRSAGSGSTGIYLDRFVLFPVVRQTGTEAVFDGARDIGQSFLFDTRQVPELVAR